MALSEVDWSNQSLFSAETFNEIIGMGLQAWPKAACQFLWGPD